MAQAGGGVRSPLAALRMPLERWCQIILALAWSQAGLWKVLDFERFRAIVDHHGLIPADRALLGAAAVAEVLPGAALAWCFAEPQRWRASRLSAALSLLFLAGLSVYVSQVPAEALRRVGCGCFGGGLGGVAGRATTPWETIVLHAAGGLLHAPVLLSRGRGRKADSAVTPRPADRAEPAGA